MIPLAPCVARCEALLLEEDDPATPGWQHAHVAAVDAAPLLLSPVPNGAWWDDAGTVEPVERVEDAAVVVVLPIVPLLVVDNAAVLLVLVLLLAVAADEDAAVVLLSSTFLCPIFSKSM